MDPICDTILQAIPEAILGLDVHGDIIYCNNASLAMSGYGKDELVFKPIHILYTEKNDDLRAEYELSIAKKKGEFSTEGWLVRKDGSKFWSSMRFARMQDEQGQHTGFTWHFNDITKKKQVELEARKREENYRLMVEAVKDYSIFMLDPGGYILTWNEGAQRIKGYLPTEIIGKHFSIFYPADDKEKNKPALELKTALSEGKFEEEGWRVRKNGSLFWASVVLTPLFNQQNKHIGFSKVTRDLTDKKHNEETLRQSEERYRLLVEQVTDYGIFMLDEKGRVISWNEGAKNIKGYTADEIIGKYFSIFYPEEDILSGKPERELKIAIAEGKYEEEGWRLRKDGTRFWANVVITAVYNEDHNHVGFSKVTRDLTERKENERALRESYERFRTLANELKHTNRELSDANEQLGQFTSIVSHDLQEPVRTIKSFLQLIENQLQEKKYDNLYTYIKKAEASAKRMRELILNLLNYSQVSNTEIKKEKVQVDEVISHTLQNLKTSLESSNVKVNIENTVPVVAGDRIQLEQLFQNLLSNAFKFTNSHRPEVTLRSTTENGYYRFSVSDNGIGIAQADMGKIFEIFRRLNTEKEYPGTGIGLAICKKIVERHGGRIWLESEPGKGTTFYFTLPR